MDIPHRGTEFPYFAWCFFLPSLGHVCGVREHIHTHTSSAQRPTFQIKVKSVNPRSSCPLPKKKPGHELREQHLFLISYLHRTSPSMPSGANKSPAGGAQRWGDRNSSIHISRDPKEELEAGVLNGSTPSHSGRVQTLRVAAQARDGSEGVTGCECLFVR